METTNLLLCQLVWRPPRGLLGVQYRLWLPSTCILSPWASGCLASPTENSVSSFSPFFSVSLTPSHVGPYSPLRLTALLSPNGNTPLKKVNILPQNIVVEPILDSRRRRSFRVRSNTRALPLCGTMPLVRRVARDSIHEKTCEHEAIV